VLGLALIATASGEYTRETLRKPYVIGRHMYSNGVRTRDVARFNETGYLKNPMWTVNARVANTNLITGETMFRSQCMSCHTKDGYRSIQRLIGGRNKESVMSLLKILHDFKPDSPYRAYMPPLVGSAQEIDALAEYLTFMANKPKGTPDKTGDKKNLAQSVNGVAVAVP
jgi:mono/diheme cytochrome c family protein